MDHKQLEDENDTSPDDAQDLAPQFRRGIAGKHSEVLAVSVVGHTMNSGGDLGVNRYFRVLYISMLCRVMTKTTTRMTAKKSRRVLGVQIGLCVKRQLW